MANDALGSPMKAGPANSDLTCLYVGDAAAGTKEAGYQYGGSYAPGSRVSMSAYANTPQFEPLADVGEEAYIQDVKQTVSDSNDPSGRVELDRPTIVAYSNGYVLSLGAIGAPRDVVIRDIKVVLSRLPQ
jgi:hypothetical protein